MAVPTLEEIEATLVENAGFKARRSLPKAIAFAEAAAQYIILRNESASGQSASITFGKQSLMELLRSAEELIEASEKKGSSNTRVRHMSFRNFR